MSIKPAKTERIEFRAYPEQAERVRRAAAVAQRSTSQFILEAAEAEADRVLTGLAVTRIEPEFFDRLWDEIDIAEPNERLARQAASPRRVVQR